MTSEKKRKRIHPAIAVAAIAGITIIAVAAKLRGENEITTVQMIAIAIIAYIAGVKMRLLKRFPLT